MKKNNPHDKDDSPVISLIRRPHGYFPGGVTKADIIPPITTSHFECNTLILFEC